MPTSTALGCAQCPLDLDVIGTNYDGTTAGKIRARRPGIAFIALAGKPWPPCLGLRFAARAATTERVVVNRYSGVAIEGFDPVAYFADARPVRRPAGFRGLRSRRRLALPQRGQPRLFCRPSRYLRPPVRRLRPDRSGARRHLCRQSPVLADLGTAALSVRPRGEPRSPLPPIPARFLQARRSRAGRAGAEPGAVGLLTRSHAAAGSPQAMNSGTMKSFAGLARNALGALRIGDLAAGRGDDRMSRRDVPFAGRGRGGDRCRPRPPPPGRI